MEISDYQAQAHTVSLETSIGGDLVVYPALGLANEAGEVLGKLKKIYRDAGGVRDQAAQDGLIGEIGDVLWYLAELSTQLGISLDAAARANINKLLSRQARGVLTGSGDTR